MTPKQAAPETRRHYGRPRSIRAKLAEAFQRTVGGVDQALYGPESARNKMLAYIRIAQTHEAWPWLRKYLKPLLDATREGPVPDLDVPVIAAASQADAREDASQAVAQATDLLPDLERWLRDLDAELAAQAELRAALWSEIQARRA